MKLRSLTVNQFKRFTAPTRLAGVGDGLNLVVGPNELGKSTLLDALRAVLFERHQSKAAPIRALQNDRSGAGPVVELVFEIDGAEYTLTKRFVRNPYARLQMPGGAVLEADLAEAQLRRVLGFSEAGVRGANLESLGMWGVLWVQQGQSFGRPNLPDSALASLSAGLESEVGAVLGGRRGRELPQAIERLLDELVTRQRRQPRGEYALALDNVSQLEEQLSRQQQQQREMSETLEQLNAAEERRRRLDDAERDQEEQTQLREARGQLEEVERSRLKLTAARSRLETRQSRLEQALRARGERAKQRAEIAADEERLEQERGRLRTLREQEAELRTPLEALRQTLREAEAAVEAASTDETRQRSIVTALGVAAELSALEDRQRELAGAQQRLAEAREQAERIRVDDRALAGIRNAANALDRANAQVGGAAARIHFEMDADRLAGITVDGEPIADPSLTIEALEPTVISIPGRGRIVIDPAVANQDALRRSQRQAQTAMQEALAQAGVESLAEAEILRDRRRGLESVADAAESELERLQPEGEDEVAQRIAALRGELAGLTPDGRGMLPERQEAEAALSRAQAALEAARRAELAARAAVEERSERVSAVSGDVRNAKAQAAFRSELVEQRLEALRRDAEAAPDETLDADAAAAGQEAAAQEQVVAALEADWSEGERRQLEARIERLEGVIDERARKRADLDTEIARLSERIELHESAGIDEAVEHSRHELEQATRRRERLEREVAVLQLLSETLRQAESEARERYLAPVLNRVRPYLQMLFPNAEISMDEELNITGMSRIDGYEERFDHLSMGTQEQIAILVRLAFAEMLIEQGAPAAVILDDALVFSDDQRMSLMFDILSHASKQVQIVIFTCREQLFEGLSARQLQLAAADPESLRSA